VHSNSLGPPGPWLRNVALVEDHLMQRLHMVELVGAQRGLRVVHDSETLPELLRWLTHVHDGDRPDLAVLDLHSDHGPDATPEGVQQVLRAGVRVLVMSSYRSAAAVQAFMSVGVSAFVGKRDPEDEVIAAVWSALAGRPWRSTELDTLVSHPDRAPRLSDQEGRALSLFVSGLTVTEVARQLGVRPETAKTYLTRIRQKYADLGRPVRSRTDMAREALRDGLVGIDGLDRHSGASGI
jgi:DNA-binding NarL/FixJ family response regulator